MLTSSTFASLQALVKGVIEGKTSPKRLAWFCVYGSGNLTRCLKLIGTTQKVLGSSDKGLRLLDAQLEIEKLLDQPELVAQ